LLLQASCYYLQSNVDNKLEEPKDWIRSIPNSKYHKTECGILKDFLLSPTTIVFDYKANKSFWEDMEHAIRSVIIDLKMEAIRKGSPHTLRITKTKAAYQREVKKWSQDKE